MDKLVSVNITTYNREKLLPRCLDSVLSQSYENMEIIIVDDCSNDNSKGVIEAYQKKDSRIKYIRHDTNKKNATARNTAWQNSKGYYIAFMDDDDEWIDKDKLKKQVEVFENSDDEKLALISTSVRLFADENNFTNKIITRPQNLEAHILSRNGIIYSPTVMTKREIIEKVGGFDPAIPRGVDSDLYRMIIVVYGYDSVYFMPDVTTAIYEFGVDRMTKMDTEDDLLSHVNNFELKLGKYEKELKKYLVSKASIELTLARLNYKLYRLTKKAAYKNAFESYAGRALKSSFSAGNIMKVIVLYLRFALKR
jgi:glycosyltransferase involved in cell wall biosynthesis